MLGDSTLVSRDGCWGKKGPERVVYPGKNAGEPATVVDRGLNFEEIWGCWG